MAHDERVRWARRAVSGYVAYVALSAAVLVIAGAILLVIAIARA